MDCRISIEVMDAGFEVEIPDMDAMKKAETAAKKKGDTCVPYMGDMKKCYAVKTAKEVMALVKAAVEKMPENDYDAAFKEAAAQMSD